MNLDGFGRSPLHYAALSGDVSEVERLLAEGTDPSLADRSGHTPLHFAAQEQRASCVPILVAAGASVDVRDRWGNTPLFRAVFDSRGNGDTVSALLAAGADPDILNHSGVSPRSLAQRVASDEVIRLIP